MSSSTTTERFPSAAGPVVLTGTPVVPGVALGPVVRPAGAVQLPAGDAPSLAEAVRPEEKARFVAAADVVADRLTARARRRVSRLRVGFHRLLDDLMGAGGFDEALAIVVERRGVRALPTDNGAPRPGPAGTGPTATGPLQ